MNNRGQTLVLFVVLIPFVLAICAFVFDSAYIIIKNNQLESIAKSSIKSIMEDGYNQNDIKNVIEKNDSNIEIVYLDEDSIHLNNEIKPIFGQIIGLDKYELDIWVVGKYIGDKLIIEEKRN